MTDFSKITHHSHLIFACSNYYVYKREARKRGFKVKTKEFFEQFKNKLND